MADSPPRRRPNVLTIPAGVHFLPALAHGLLDGTVVPGFAPRHDPIALADATIYLPTRRAARALREAFLGALDGRATLLPRIAPLGDVDEDESLSDFGADDAELPPAAAPLERRLTLARLVSAFAAALDRSILKLDRDDGPLIPSTAADAIHLAGDLEALIDAIETDEADLANIDALVPGEHDSYWAITQAFLKVALRAWPDHVEAQGRLDPTTRRRRQIEAATRRVASGRGPVIAAGSTGSQSATRRLISAIASHPQGAVVLPGFDLDGLDGAGWRELLEGDGPGLFGHPQRGLARLVRELGLAREEVRTLQAASPALAARARLAAEALRPADTTDAWSQRRPAQGQIASALENVALIEAPHLRAEAAAIAVALREAIATPEKTAALITPDRNLAARVAAELERWGVTIDDSAGRPLAGTPAGALLRLAAETALDPRPELLLALLRAPACRLPALAGAVDVLDVAVLRAPLPGVGLEGVWLALLNPPERPRGPARRFSAADRTDSLALVEHLSAALGPLIACSDAATEPLSRLVEALAVAYGALSEGAESDDHHDVMAFLDELTEASAAADAIAPASFPGVIEALIAGRVLRPPRDRHPRLRILGPLEARLLRFDRIILGGLNEGTWPAVPQADPWINRPLRAALGLAPPERRIGLSAHDFVQGLGADEVILARARKVGGAPTIPSRWLQRLAAVAGPSYDEARTRGARYVSLAESLDTVERAPQPRPPEPRPPLEIRPRRLSVTAVETWLRDPYSIYARHILRLDELDPVGPEPGPADLGNVVHKALESFALAGIPLDAPDALERLVDFGDAAFGALLARDDVRLMWRPRFAAIAAWTLDFHRDRGALVESSFVERDGALAFTTTAGREFTLNARADRIDAFRDGTFSFLDYKTGRVASVRQALAGFAPQLPLEGAILRQGGFAPAAPSGSVVSELAFVRLVGRDPAGEIVDIRDKTAGPDEIAATAWERFKEVVDRFENPDEPYRSLSHPKFLSRPEGPYAHLARVKEWSSTGGAAEGDAE